MKHLYLEKLKRMTPEQLLNECHRLGKTMEQNHPLTKDEISRCYMGFKWAYEKGGFDENERQMLLTAIRVLRLF